MLYIGPHTSISGSVGNAPSRAHSLGATGFAIFTRNQRTWAIKPLSVEDSDLFKAEMEKYGYTKECVLPHAGYLINPATYKEDLWEKSRNLLLEEGRRTLQLGLDNINLHPGAYTDGTPEDGMKRTARMLDEVLDELPGLTLCLENTAGSGTILGSTFEELSTILDHARNKDRIGFCLDTAHLCGSGYDVKNGIEKIMEDFEKRFGKDKLLGMHINDSKVPLSSKKDRHAPLGQGEIGMDAFKRLVRLDIVQNKPLVLETPDETRWPMEINTLLQELEH